jgi:penicillin-binding protein/penicillin-binding protein 1A
LRVLGYLGLGIGGCATVLIGAAAGYVTSMLKGLPTVTAETFTNLSEPTIVYDRNGKPIGKFAADGDRQPIASVKEVSPYLVNAFIAAEDKTFYSNIGINPMAIVRAAFQDIVGHRIVSGASTITQQTVKLALFPEQERTAKRKIQEIALAIKVNNLLTKDEILTDYMNWVYMGRMGYNNVYGVKAAAQILFHKDVKNLTLPEAAFLAAIPNNASLFSPYEHPQNTVERQHYILEQMLENGMITKQQYDDALKVDVTKEIKQPPKTYLKYPYVLDDNVKPLVAQYLVEAGKYDKVADAEAALPTAGFKVYTTIDLSDQDTVDNVLKDKQLFQGSTKPAKDQVTGKPIRDKNGKQLMDLYEAGVTLIDNQTGGILAIGGGRDYDHWFIDHSDIPRPPGSSIKPLLDYGPAMEMNLITAATPLADVPVSYTGGDGSQWNPQDDDNRWKGIVTVRQALTESRNIPAIRVLDMIHPQVAGQFLAKMGITPQSKTLQGQPTLVSDDLTHLSTAIGGMKYGLTVQQMTSAYTVFPNQGVWRPAYLIEKITDRNGNVLYQHKPEAHKVFSAQTAYIMTDILHDVVYAPGGTAGAIGRHFPGYYIAGKTGTTDDYRDGWFIGFTPKYTMGIWMGYDYREKIDTWATGYDWYSLKFTLWNKMMDPILRKDPPTQPFPRPGGITTALVCKKSGDVPTDLCRSAHDVYTELFKVGTEPNTTCKVHVTALYTVVNGKKYLATTNTPPSEIRQGVFILPPDGYKPGVVTADMDEYVPTQPDPRGGSVLQGPTTGKIDTLPAPQILHAVADQKGSVQLAWSAVQGATGYTVWRSTSPGGPYVNIAGPVSGTTFVDNTVPGSAAQVYYEVFAVSNSGVSPPSAPVAVQLGSSGGNPGNGGNGNQGNHTGPGSGGKGNTESGTGLPDMLWPSEDHYRSR